MSLRHPVPNKLDPNEQGKWSIFFFLWSLECDFSILGRSISISNPNILGLFSTERSTRDLENQNIDWDLSMKKWHSKCNRLCMAESVTPDESCHMRTLICAMTPLYGTWLLYMCHDSLTPDESCHMRKLICAIWLFYMGHDSFIWDMTPLYGTWLLYMWHDSFIWDMTPLYGTWLLYVWHDSFICDMTPWYVRYDSFISAMTPLYVTWLIYMCHDSFICDMTPLYVTWLLDMCDMTPL